MSFILFVKGFVKMSPENSDEKCVFGAHSSGIVVKKILPSMYAFKQWLDIIWEGCFKLDCCTEYAGSMAETAFLSDLMFPL